MHEPSLPWTEPWENPTFGGPISWSFQRRQNDGPRQKTSSQVLCHSHAIGFIVMRNRCMFNTSVKAHVDPSLNGHENRPAKVRHAEGHPAFCVDLFHTASHLFF